MKLRGIVQDLATGLRQDVRSTIKLMGSKVRTGTPPIWEFPMGLSTSFGETTKTRFITTIRGVLRKHLPVYERFERKTWLR